MATDTDQELYAHTPPDDGTGDWQLLSEHLNNVAAQGAQFGIAFGAEAIVKATGLLHDIGKSSKPFQRYLRLNHDFPNKKHRTTDHKGAGTMVAMGLPKQNHAITFSILGHHGGLPNPDYLQDKIEEWRRTPPESNPIPGVAPLPDPSLLLPQAWVTGNALAYDLYIRLVFSALIDADRLDTEQHNSHDHADVRDRSLPSIAELRQRFYDRTQSFNDEISPLVRSVREELYASCERAASKPAGLFRVTAPTGSAKTRAALAFALNHAVCNELRRVIVVSPYLTITDQIADEYRKWLGADAVLEHHSDAARHEQRNRTQFINEEEINETEQPSKQWRELVAENWDAPVVVTTQVQFFESLFSHQTSRARKVHNIAKSVVILDEFQSMPTHLLEPSVDMLRLLIAHAGVSVVLSTATQPALDRLPLTVALPTPIELAPDPPATFAALKRVSFSWDNPNDTQSWEAIAELIRAEHQSLAIVNTRKDALALLGEVGQDALHLSTLLCPAHRRDVLSNVRKRLKQDMPCHVVSTQVIEAGVDISFPVVFRAYGPLDRIIQAAGRCNRHGEIPTGGRVYIINPELGGIPKGAYLTATELTRSLRAEKAIDLHNPTTIENYFGELYRLTDTDQPEPGKQTRIQNLRKTLNFRDVGSLFRLIPDSVSVLVPYQPDPQLRSPAENLRLRAERRRAQGLGLGKELAEDLQAYSVSLPQRDVQRLEEQGVIEALIDDSLYWCDVYDGTRGIDVELHPSHGVLIV